MQGAAHAAGADGFCFVLGDWRTVPLVAHQLDEDDGILVACWEDACSLRGKSHRGWLVYDPVDRANAHHLAGVGDPLLAGARLGIVCSWCVVPEPRVFGVFNGELNA